jgi:hypothetical protein
LHGIARSNLQVVIGSSPAHLRIPGLGAAANSRRYVTKGSGSNEIGRILLPIDV